MTKAHPLIEYVRRTGTSMEAVAEKAECSRVSLYRIMAGKQNATMETLLRISAATGGEVPPSAFFPQVAA